MCAGVAADVCLCEKYLLSLYCLCLSVMSGGLLIAASDASSTETCIMGNVGMRFLHDTSISGSAVP